MFKPRRKELCFACFAMIVLGVLSLVVTLRLNLSILRNADAGTDSSVFQVVAMVMRHGGMPYLDTFDHKGPILYLINYLGQCIAFYRGVWVFECIAVFSTLLLMYGTARLNCGRWMSFIAVLIPATLFLKYFVAGNYSEEYAMPFIAAAGYIFLDYFLNGRIGRFRLILCGLSLGVVFLLRPNMIAVWIIFCVSVFIHAFLMRDPKRLLNFILWFLIGFCAIVLPIVLWLIIKGAFHAFVEQYFLFNFAYAAFESYSLADRWDAVFSFLKEPITLLAVTLLILESFLHARNWRVKSTQASDGGAREEKQSLYLSVTYTLYLLLSVYFLCMSGRKYEHYGLVLVPAIVHPYALICGRFEQELKTKGSVALQLVLVYLVVTVALPGWISGVGSVIRYYDERGGNQMDETVSEISTFIRNETNEDSLISVYGNWDVIYMRSKRMPASKYSYQSPVKDVWPSIMDEYLADLSSEQPTIIVIKKLDERMESFLNDNGYSMVWAQNDEDTWKDGALIYQKADS